MTVLKFLAGFLAVPAGLGICFFIYWALEEGPKWAAAIAMLLIGVIIAAVCTVFGLAAIGVFD